MDFRKLRGEKQRKENLGFERKPKEDFVFLIFSFQPCVFADPRSGVEGCFQSLPSRLKFLKGRGNKLNPLELLCNICICMILGVLFAVLWLFWLDIHMELPTPPWYISLQF